MKLFQIMLLILIMGISPALALDGLVDKSEIDRETLCAISRSRKCDIKLAIKYGLFETGLQPQFPEGMICRDIDSEQWAISYTSKRPQESYHGGIDMPAPFGTPIVAVADGTVVGLYAGEESYRGREIVLRHSPEDTGIPMWIYTQYTHFDAMPPFKVGDRVKMGQELGPTGNSGIPGGKKKNKKKKNRRRPAIHFATWFSESPDFYDNGRGIIPKGGQWMDPNALYRGVPPFDSQSMKNLPDSQKRIAIPVMVEGGGFVPADTKLIWPYTCSPK
ncbi:M23 family metallopeptidase [Pseudodesulfovibrio sp.]|nr:M23 family metallopeptidase [Pseudodesulfovibrio sp.]